MSGLSQLRTAHLHFHGFPGTHQVLLWLVQELYAAKVAGNLIGALSQFCAANLHNDQSHEPMFCLFRSCMEQRWQET